MSENSHEGLPLPPLVETCEGKTRRVGVELELGGLDIDTLSSIVADHIQGAVHVVSSYEHEVRGDAAGDWKVELDFEFLKSRGRQRNERDSEPGPLEEAAEQLIRMGSEQLVPMEVVTPPLPMDQLHSVERLIGRLRDAGARGTRDGLAFAFGMHLNPELPSTDASTITRYLKAFLCLFDWIKSEESIDFTRRLTTYIDPFPQDYVCRVIDPDYAPDLTTLMDDYLHANPTRNRALDLLPLFAELDEARVRAAVDDARIKARAALHYRLPNCEIGRPGWGMTGAWRDWLQVEYLTVDDARRNDMCRAYEEHLRRPITRLTDDWAHIAKSWLIDPDDR